MTINYTSLKSTLKQYVEDDGTEYNAALPRIIKQAESRVAKDLDLEIFNGRQNGTVSTQFINNPVDFISVQYLFVNGVALQPRSDEWLVDYGGSGQPLYYGHYNTAGIRIKPTPSQAYSYTLVYRAEPDALSATNGTTWISENVTDALIYACLMESEAFLKSDERLPVWTAAYTDAINKFKAQHPELARKVYP